MSKSLLKTFYFPRLGRFRLFWVCVVWGLKSNYLVYFEKEKQSWVWCKLIRIVGFVFFWMLLIGLGWRCLTSTVVIKCPSLRHQRKESLVCHLAVGLDPLCHNHWSDWWEWWGQLTHHCAPRQTASVARSDCPSHVSDPQQGSFFLSCWLFFFFFWSNCSSLKLCEIS